MGPKCGVTISHIDKYDATGNIISGGINLHFGQVASDNSKYLDYTNIMSSDYICEDSKSFMPGLTCGSGYVKSFNGVVQETLHVPKPVSRRRRDTLFE